MTPVQPTSPTHTQTLPGENPARVAVPEPGISVAALASNAVLGLLGMAFLAPLLWLIAAAVDREPDWGIRLPSLTFQNFRSVVAEQGLRSFYNSLYLATAASLLATAIAFLAAYPLSRHHVPLKRPLMLSVLFASGLPVSLLLVPTYQLYVFLGWLDSLFTTALFLAASSLPFAIWLLKNFIDAVPVELEEAATMEGAGALVTLRRVIVPLTLPGLSVTAIYTFINAWGAFIAPLILNGNPDDQPGPIAIFHFMGNHGVFLFGQLAAYSFMFSVPVVVLYLVMARHFSGAFNFSGGLKG